MHEIKLDGFRMGVLVGGSGTTRGARIRSRNGTDYTAEFPEVVAAAMELPARDALLEGGTCHPFRRKWKSERANHPVKAVAVAGGWTDIATMLRCYDHPDDADVLAVTSEPRKRQDFSVGDAEASG